MASLTAIALGGVFTLMGVWAVGRIAWRFRPPSVAMAVAAGAPIASLMLFGLLSARLAYGWLIAALLAAAIVAALFGPKKRPECQCHWLLVPLAAYGVYYLVHALAPEIQPDGTTYHLGLPAEWLRLHGFAPRVGFYEVLPLGMETFFLPAFWIGAHSAAKLVHFGLLLLTVPLMVRVARQLGLSVGQGFAGAALYFMMPVAGITGTASYNDAALVFLALAAFSLLLEDETTPQYWPLVMAGLAAGFCYAIKVTGILVPAGGLLWLLLRRRRGGAALFAIMAAAVIVPWVWRSWQMTGNPLAPLGNSLFPNDYFRATSERNLAEFLRRYGLTSWKELPWGLTVDGRPVQGLTGPVFLLAPLALLALRRRAGRLLLSAALLLALPWPMNIGARFLLPSLAFLSLAMAAALPWRAIAGVAVLHAALCWPWVCERYASEHAWRLKGFPWRAALRLEPESEYLSRNFEDYVQVKLVSEKLPPGEPLLDLYMLPYAYLRFVPMVPMPLALAENMARALTVPIENQMAPLHSMECRFPLEFARAVRVRIDRAPSWDQWIAEIEVYRGGERLYPSKFWLVDAWPNAGDAWLIADGNRTSRWWPDRDTSAGMYVEVQFDRPIPIDEVRVIAPNLLRDVRLEVYAHGIDRIWKKRSTGVDPKRVPFRPMRREAIAFVKSQGYRWILVRTEGAGYTDIGRSMLALPESWGVELAGQTWNSALFRVK